MNMKRTIGKYIGNKKGALLQFTVGVHGNEPSGLIALKKVFSELEKEKPEILGGVLGLAGNLAALEKNTRYIDEDLNRTWTKEKLSQTQGDVHEIKEMHEILSAMKVGEKGFTKRYFIDCHSLSSESLPYLSVEDVGGNKQWSRHFSIYIVIGFSSIVEGSIDGYFSEQGMTGFAIEAGRHDAETTVKNQEAIMWLAIRDVCGLDLEKMGCYPECVEAFDKNPPQKTFKIIYRHGLEKSDEFKMKPGFKNFQKIEKGEILAEQNGREIISEWEARIFMPLYQPQGSDGFFVIEEIPVS